MNVYINLIKIIATFMITNSHMGALYPRDYFAFGGALGNALFFLVAGYCLSSKRKNEFIPWMGNRLQRLYVPLWSVTLLLIVIGDVSVDRSNLVTSFFFPYNSFWFVSAMIVNYVLFYFIRKYLYDRLNVIAVIAIGVYTVWYVGFLDTTIWSVENAGFFKYAFYFMVMLTGIALKKYESFLFVFLKGKSIVLMICAVLCFTGHTIMRMITIKIPEMMQFQFVVQVFTWGFATTFFLFMLSIENSLKKYFTGSILRKISDSTLEIYLVNMMVISRMSVVGGIISIPVTFILIFIIGICIHELTGKCIKKISRA